MKIKRPSLKGMKHTKYLGHFAQDKYIQQGHNFSGRFPLFREPSQLEMMGPSNAFDATNEFKRRQEQVDAEAAAIRAAAPEMNPQISAIQSDITALQDPRAKASAMQTGYGKAYGGRGALQAKYAVGKLQQDLQSAQAASKEAQEATFRTSRKKFLSEL